MTLNSNHRKCIVAKCGAGWRQQRNTKRKAVIVTINGILRDAHAFSVVIAFQNVLFVSVVVVAFFFSLCKFFIQPHGWRSGVNILQCDRLYGCRTNWLYFYAQRTGSAFSMRSSASMAGWLFFFRTSPGLREDKEKNWILSRTDVSRAYEPTYSIFVHSWKRFVCVSSRHWMLQ